MYLLSYLKGLESTKDKSFDATVEFRLACSGEFYNRVAGDWRHFETARILLVSPFELYVVSRPFNALPQELCLRFGLQYDWDHQPGGGSIGRTPPYPELVEDLCAILTLLSRRLVVPVFEVRLVSKREDHDLWQRTSFDYDHPSPSLGRTDVRGQTLKTARAETVGATVSIVDHTPPPLGINRDRLQHALSALTTSRYASAILDAARAYSSALQLILPRPELAYQLLISSVETLANVRYSNYRPSKEEMIKHKQRVRNKAKKAGLTNEQADALAIEACKGEHWTGRKFRTFFAEYLPAQIPEPDELFPLADGWDPRRQDFPKVLTRIYNARSKHLHEGKAFPEWISFGQTVALSPSHHGITVTAATYIPPVTWFERTVSLALKGFFASERKPGGEEPFTTIAATGATPGRSSVS
jgi:hypothetical protein